MKAENRTGDALLTGTLRHSDARALLDAASAGLAAGSLHFAAHDLDTVEPGPLQVLVCAALDARARGLPCKIDDAARPALDRALAALRLPDAATFFTFSSANGGH